MNLLKLRWSCFMDWFSKCNFLWFGLKIISVAFSKDYINIYFSYQCFSTTTKGIFIINNPFWTKTWHFYMNFSKIDTILQLEIWLFLSSPHLLKDFEIDFDCSSLYILSVDWVEESEFASSRKRYFAALFSRGIIQIYTANSNVYECQLFNIYIASWYFFSFVLILAILLSM